MPQRPIELHMWPTPNAFKITIFLEEASLPYEVKLVDIGKGEQFAPEFLRISPNNRMPAIVDPDGPGGKPISVFESGAILQYLGRKTAKFYPADERQRVNVDQWVMWQMGGLGPMAGQANHFRIYAPEKLEYAINRYTNEVNRLFGVLNRQLEGKEYVCGAYSIADMMSFPWVRPWERMGQQIADFPHLKAWFERMEARPGVQRGLEVGREAQGTVDLSTDKAAQSVLFGQKAR